MKRSFARRTFLKIAGTTAVLAGCGPNAGSDSNDLDEDTFDYIVVGSGAGGGPLASNLARSGFRVLLLEAGADRGDRLTYQVPAFHPQSTEDETMRWDYFVKHYEDPDRQKLDSKMTPGGVLYPRAGTLGGCTSHNAMITVYPHQSDWDHIADITGDDSWRAGTMRRYFEILENCEYLGVFDSRRGHGFEGWLSTNRPNAKLALTDFKLLATVRGAADAYAESVGSNFLGGLTEVLSLMGRDLNSASSSRDSKEGLFSVPMATQDGKRNGPREFILSTIEQGFPLTLRTEALVSRVVFSEERDDNGRLRASGVEYLEGGSLYRADPKAPREGDRGTLRRVTALRDIILAAGVFNTPQLLKLSGIGPKDELESLDIPVQIHLPGVGRNLQDRYEVGVVSEVKGDFTILEDCTFGSDVNGREDPCLSEWRDGEGPYTANGVAVAIIKKSKPSKRDPDLIVFGLPGSFTGYEPGYSKKVNADKNHFTWAVLKGHTQNDAGVVRLASTNPRDVPDISFNYFDTGATDLGQDKDDLDAMVAGVELIRRIGEKTRERISSGVFTEVFPGESVKSRGDIETFVKNEAWGHHASCTCKIGADDDPTAVLDSRFRVRGTTNLRVVDASVFPKIPGFFIVTSVYMISEKATDVLLEDYGDVRR